MRILLLSDATSPHTFKWATGLAAKGIEVGIFTLSETPEGLYEGHDNISVFSIGKNNESFKNMSDLRKLAYLKNIVILRDTINKFKPDILHAHFASSYGLLGALTNFHPFIISVWGSDIYLFPKKNFLCNCLIRYNLLKADKVLSTSYAMSLETKKYTSKKIEITPFGIDLSVFKPQKVESLFEETDMVIGTVKTLEDNYGVEYLIRAFAIVKDHCPNLPLKLLIVGGGSLESNLKELAVSLSVDTDTVFTGKVPHDTVFKYHNMLTVSVFLSNSESFGVAVIEASACAKPVVVSDVGGLPEVVENDITGIVVPARNPYLAACSIIRLIESQHLRNQMGEAGRKRVEKFYKWDKNLLKMIKVYEEMLCRQI